MLSTFNNAFAMILMTHVIILQLIIVLIFPGTFYAQIKPCKVVSGPIKGAYVGGCRNGYAHGSGIANGADSYTGDFKKGLPHGEGIYTWSDSNKYEGSFRNGLMHGKGTYYIAEADSSFYGIWKFGRFIRSAKQQEQKNEKYKIIIRRNIDRTRFYKLGEGNKVVFKFSENTGTNRPFSNLHIDGSPGSYYSIGRESGFDNVRFPFNGKVRFHAPSKMRSGIVDYELQFVINEPGSWEITLFY